MKTPKGILGYFLSLQSIQCQKESIEEKIKAKNGLDTIKLQTKSKVIIQKWYTKSDNAFG